MRLRKEETSNSLENEGLNERHDSHMVRAAWMEKPPLIRDAKSARP